jgi:tripartite-type tricarboxylate transporter receptor subunit TctC
MLLASGAAALAALSRPAGAQAWPSRPVRLVEGYGAGSAPDIIARLVGQRLSERLGTPFVIDNKPGASGKIATEAVAKAAPDGYTLLLVLINNAIDAAMKDRLTYDFVRDIAPVAAIAYPWSWRSIRRFPRRPFPRSSRSPRKTPAGSTWRRPAPEPSPTLPASSSRC